MILVKKQNKITGGNKDDDPNSSSCLACGKFKINIPQQQFQPEN